MLKEIVSSQELLQEVRADIDRFVGPATNRLALLDKDILCMRKGV